MVSSVQHWEVFAPVAWLVVGALVTLLVDALGVWLRAGDTTSWRAARLGPVLATVATAALVTAIASSWGIVSDGRHIVFDPTTEIFTLDALTAIGTFIVGSAALLTVWLAVTALVAVRTGQAPFHALVLLATAGFVVTMGSGHLAMLFVGIELAALPSTILASYDVHRPTSGEAGLKVHLSSMLATGLLLFGMTLMYGATGQLSYAGLWAGLDAADLMGVAGVGLFITGLVMKLGLAPFHQWSADVLEGAPTVVTGFLSVSTMTAIVIVLLRFQAEAIAPDVAPLSHLFGILAALSIIFGQLLTLASRSLKRMLSSATVAHAGHLAIGLACTTVETHEAVLFYVFVHLFGTVGVYAAIVTFSTGARESDRIDEFRGLGRKRPILAAVLTLCLLSLAGFPGTAGFWARFNLFSAAIGEGHAALVLLALVGSAVGLYSVLRVPLAMIQAGSREREGVSISTSELGVLAVCVVVVLYLGIWPSHGMADFLSGWLG